MRNIIGRLAGAFLALALSSGLAAAQSKVTIAVGGSACLCYLPTVLARQLGEYEKAGVAVELVDLKGGSRAIKEVRAIYRSRFFDKAAVGKGGATVEIWGQH